MLVVYADQAPGIRVINASQDCCSVSVLFVSKDSQPLAVHYWWSKQRCVPKSSEGPDGWYLSFTLLQPLKASFVARPCLIVVYVELKGHSVPSRVDYFQKEGVMSLLVLYFHILCGWVSSLELYSGSQNSHEQACMLKGPLRVQAAKGYTIFNRWLQRLPWQSPSWSTRKEKAREKGAKC